MVEGIRNIELIRPDVLCATLDGGVVGALDPGNEAVVAAMGGPDELQKPEAFRITSATDPAFGGGLRPRDVCRACYEGRNSMSGKMLWPPVINKIC